MHIFQQDFVNLACSYSLVCLVCKSCAQCLMQQLRLLIINSVLYTHWDNQLDVGSPDASLVATTRDDSGAEELMASSRSLLHGLDRTGALSGSKLGLDFCTSCFKACLCLKRDSSYGIDDILVCF